MSKRLLVGHEKPVLNEDGSVSIGAKVVDVTDPTAAQDAATKAYADLHILKSLFDAQTILQATSDDTPVALTIAEERLVGRITGGNITALTPAQVHKMLGVVYPLANTYSGDPSGTAGSDGTAQTVKMVVVTANTLTQAGDRLRIRSFWTGDTGGAITGTTTLNGVTIATATDGGFASFFTTEAWLHYVDNTHANLIETGAYPATGTLSAANVAGFAWDADQDVDVDQNLIANNHIIVYAIFLDVFPKGVV